MTTELLEIWTTSDGLTAKRRGRTDRFIKAGVGNKVRLARVGLSTVGNVDPSDPSLLAWNWTDNNVPWDFDDPSEMKTKWPTGTTVVDLAGSGDFYTRLKSTVDAAGKRVVVRLQPGRYQFNQFRMIGSSGIPTYAFGFWHPNLQGLLCDQGAGQCSIEMLANSTTQAQLDRMKTMASGASGEPNQMGLMRFDGSSASPILISGVTFRSDDQQPLTAVDASVSGIGVVVPQPAPFCGVVLFSNATAYLSHVRFQAAGHAMTGLPPFEHANCTSQYGTIEYNKCEFDGRLAPEFDTARPRRCGPVMANNENLHRLIDCWLHHSNISRYAANDQNRDTQGLYEAIRCKINNISELKNVDPAQNNGQSLGGWSNASCMGWESCNGTIRLIDMILVQDNPDNSKGAAYHVGLTPVGSRGVQRGGRLIVQGGVYVNNGFTGINGFLSVWAPNSTYWSTDGLDVTMNVTNSQGVRKAAYSVTSWPPNPTTLANNGITKDTHFLVRL